MAALKPSSSSFIIFACLFLIIVPKIATEELSSDELSGIVGIGNLAEAEELSLDELSRIADIRNVPKADEGPLCWSPCTEKCKTSKDPLCSSLCVACCEFKAFRRQFCGALSKSESDDAVKKCVEGPLKIILEDGKTNRQCS